MAKVLKVLGSLDGVENLGTFIVPNLPVVAGTTSSILPGYLVIADAGNPGYVMAAPTGTSSTDVILGVALDTSTETASADGVINIVAAPVMYVQIFALTPASLTAAMKFDKFTLDVTGLDYTLDQGNNTNGIFRLATFDNIVDGNCTVTLATNW